jgi:hypothetical protein
MREFFRGWKRKIGAAALAMTCVFAMGWLRSFANYDRKFFQIDDHRFLLIFSSNSCFGTTITIQSDIRLPPDVPKIDLRFVGFSMSAEFGTNYFAGPTGQVFHVAIPYWLIVTPLTLISAWCLLSKPPSKPTAQPESGHA